jgi:hypothetical protein
MKITKPNARGIETREGWFVAVRVDAYGVKYTNKYETRDEALDDLFQLHAWPGGYPVAWVDCQKGDWLCSDCARNEFLNDEDVRAQMAAGKYTSDVYEGTTEDHRFIECANCYRVLVGEECA